VKSKSKGALIGLLAASPLLLSGCASAALFGFPIDEGDVDAGRRRFSTTAAINVTASPANGCRRLRAPIGRSSSSAARLR
jgi:hypothetical protein